MLGLVQLLSACLILAALPSLAQAQLRGHGGPVRAIAVSSDGAFALSGSFDATAIRWSLSTGTAEAVLRFHPGPVNAVAFLEGGRMATSGEDGRIAIWEKGAASPGRVLTGHTAPVVSLAVSPDGQMLASASWDGTARIWSLRDGGARVLEGHQQNVNGVAFAPDGRTLITCGYDLTLRLWPLGEGSPTPKVVTLPTPLNAVAALPDGRMITAGATGKVYFLSRLGEPETEIAAAEAPIVALAVSADGTLGAATSVRGAVAIMDLRSPRILHALVGPGLPAWSAAFLPDGRTLLTGGADRVVRRWNAATGEHIGEVAVTRVDDPLAAFADDPGAQVYRACIACHTLKAEDGPRAGPTLAGVFGRRIASLPGYDFSPALKKLEIVWTPETLSKLFEIGPAAYTPGTKMPEQKVGASDLQALVKFLQKATAR